MKLFVFATLTAFASFASAQALFSAVSPDGHFIPNASISQNGEAIEVSAPGFVSAVYVGIGTTPQLLKLRPQPEALAATRYELKGNTSGYGRLSDDGTFDLGLIVQAVPRSQLSTINLQTLISPETDHFTVLGQSVDLPSNIALPDQTESYGWIPLSFDKPTYRLYTLATGTFQIASLHASVPFEQTIDTLQKGKSMVDIVNTFNFSEGSVTPVNIQQSTQSQDVVVNQQKFTKSIAFKAPAYDSSLNLLTIALANANDQFYPTDIKNVASASTVQLSAPAGAAQTGMVLAAYKKAGTKSVGAEADQFSAVVLPNNEQRPFDPIRLVNPPQVSGAQLILDTPQVPATLTPVMTYAALNLVTLTTQGKLKIESKTPVIDVWAPAWVNKIDLPQIPPVSVDPSTQKLRWEVGFSAQFVGQKSIPAGPDALEKITHVTRSAVDL